MATKLENVTLLTGQVLQIRDKIVAKRHLIPASLANEWASLRAQAAHLDPSENATTVRSHRSQATKHLDFIGSADDLEILVEELAAFDSQLKPKPSDANNHA